MTTVWERTNSDTAETKGENNPGKTQRGVPERPPLKPRLGEAGSGAADK